MADEKELNLEGVEEKPKSGFKLDIKIAIPILLAQIITSYLLASFVIVPAFFSPVQAGQEVEEEEEGDDGEFGIVYQVEDIIVNPAESGGTHYVVINMAFELDSEEDSEILHKKDPKLRDILIRTISSKTIEQLDGPDDKEQLRMEIMEQVSELLPKKGNLDNVYFVSFIIQ